ncbi:hypothetical protein OJ997_23585 [Solirubrobacter phytolaccae]|uniref:Uncharacterized protein n=1 Tax=Solirubrobacter phytolaccae TaxID=1404360 RepID=A0A9X3NBB3_9ACTN|nr:hypothetical protein [Solirubrobacter phytolaccae]MDA0183313.1 hypothetical protein [Solirubrobacter phytolaccae]
MADREFELPPTVTHAAISQVLAGQAPYDELSDYAQAVVRASWTERTAARVASADFTERLRAAGRPWHEADVEGATVVRGDDSTSPEA